LGTLARLILRESVSISAMADTAVQANPTVVCVLGMHRSGTSLLSRIINLLGYDLGPKEHLMIPTESNPKGFWENQLITNLDDEILATFGGTWDKPPSFPDGWEISPQLDNLRENARAIIDTDFGKTPRWSWKDPRACLTLPFWQGVMPPMRYVITLRNPMDVAQSLAKRDGFAVEKGVDLWLAHVHAALAQTAGQPRALFFYDDFLEDWESELERLSSFVGSKHEHLENNCRAEVRSFVDEELRHHRTSLLDAVRDPRLSFPSKSFYLALRLSVSDHRGPNGSVDRELDGLLDHFGGYAANANFGNLCEDADLAEQLAALKVSLASTKSEAMAQKGVIDELNIAIRLYENLSSQKDAKLARLTTDQERLTQQTLQLEGSIQVQRRRLVAIENSLAWILVMRYRSLRDAILPTETRRRRVYELIKDLSKSIVIDSGDATQPQNLSVSRIVRLWRQVAYNSISFQTLIPVTQSTTVIGSEHGIRWIPFVQIGRESKSALLCHPTTAITYKLVVPSNARFFAGVALIPEAWGQNHGGVEFEVRVRSLGKSAERKCQRLIDPTRMKQHRRWIPFSLTLRTFASQEVEVTLATSLPSGATNAFAWAVWGDPLILCRKPFHQLVSICRAYVRAYGFLGTVRKGINKIRYSVDGQPVPRHNYPTWLDHSNGRPFVFAQTIGEVANSILTLPKEAIEGKVSVVIPTKNGMSEDFESTLQAIYQQKGISDLEVIVVDSGSTDSTVQTARDYGAKVLTIPPEEFNHGATRNYAAEQSTGDILVFMVQDAIPATQDLFHEMAKALLGDGKLAGLSVRQIPKSDADIYACWEMWNHYRFLFEAPLPRLTSPEDFDRLPSQQLRRLAGLDNVCSMVRRELWENSRFKATPFAEDLEFGLSCVKQGYTIGLLPHRGVIHSHTRSAYYSMSRHYIDMLVLLRLFKGESQAKWIEAVNPDQLLSSVKSVYLTIIDFLRLLDKTFRLDPANSVTQLISFLSSNQDVIQRSYDGGGESTLDKFFDVLNEVVKNDRAKVNPCQLAFEGTINSLLHFLSDRYPILEKPEFVSLIYKAYAGAAGSVLGEYSYWQSQRGNRSKQMETLDNLLQGGIV
jgi:glycosyltransferase involved in cell wall biosynthesis